jgi:Putative zinc- or iron-chelating domain
MRRCGECQLCCKLLPIRARDSAKTVRAMVDAGLATRAEFADAIPEFDKPANTRCQHQRHAKGCAIYAKRPLSCRLWSCRWLTESDTADQHRPDHSHVVIDAVPDMVSLQDNLTGQRRDIPVIQIWVDPAYPDAHQDPAIRAYVARQAERGVLALIRNGSSDAFLLVAPGSASDGVWHEVRGMMDMREDHRWGRPPAVTP